MTTQSSLDADQALLDTAVEVPDASENGARKTPEHPLVAESVAIVRRWLELGAATVQVASCPTVSRRDIPDAPEGATAAETIDRADLDAQMEILAGHLRARSDQYLRHIHGMLTGKRIPLPADKELKDL